MDGSFAEGLLCVLAGGTQYVWDPDRILADSNMDKMAALALSS
jgi:hypothetical protein